MAWVAQETFSGYADATDLSGLNGVGGWSAAWQEGGTAGIVTDAAVTYEGSRSAKSTSATVNTGNNFRQLATDLTGDGNVMYLAMRRSVNNSGSHRYNFRNPADSSRFSVVMLASGVLQLKSETAGTSQTLVATYSVDTWYVIRLTINTAAGTVTAAVSTDAFGSAGTFGSESSAATFTAGDLRYVLLDADPDGAGSGATMYWDYISAVNPFTNDEVLSDNFDSYNTGDLSGQGNWQGSASWDVQTTEFQSSPNAAASAVNGTVIEKALRATTNENQVFYIRCNELNVGQTNHVVRFLQGDTTLFRILMNEGGGSPGDIILAGTAETVVATWVVNTWYKVEVEWQASDDTVRARVDDGTWTSFVAAATTFATVNTVRLENADGDTSTFYVDTFSAPASAATAVRRNLMTLGVGR